MFRAFTVDQVQHDTHRVEWLCFWKKPFEGNSVDAGCSVSTRSGVSCFSDNATDMTWWIFVSIMQTMLK